MNEDQRRLHPVFRWIERLFWTAVIVWVAVRIAPQASAWTGLGANDLAAPTITVTTIDGTTIDETDLDGQVVVLSFWATWCLPCRVEMPALQKLHERYADDGLVVLGLGTDTHDRAAVETFMAEREITFPVAPASPEIRAAFGGIDRLPTTIIVDRQGMIRHQVVGLFAPPALGAAVRRLLRDD
jgi:peroxiredoxin